MNFKTQILDENNKEAYDTFLLAQENSLLYYSANFKNLLEKYIGCRTYYTLALDLENNLVGVFPLAIFDSEDHGKVANSLPFYGSNGGPLVSNNLSRSDQESVTKLLTQSSLDIIQNNNCVASTFITNPLNPAVNEWFKANLDYTYLDYRIGQITTLPLNSDLIEDDLFQLYDKPRPRNIRKAIKSGVTIRVSNEKKDLEFLFSVHKNNIEAIGGHAKEYQFFTDVFETMPHNTYDIIIAEVEERPIAGLLIFYYNKTVEYFTPATVHEYRNLQPSSLIIHEAMKLAVQNGYKFWNWGGTWKTQDGVYDFKKKWGAADYKYYYYTKLYDNKILDLSPKELLQNFPNTFVVPFDKLSK